MIPAERFPLGEYIKEEMEARGWTSSDLARRMEGKSVIVDECAIDMLIAVPESRIDQEMADDMGRAFGVSPQLFLHLQEAYFGEPAALTDRTERNKSGGPTYEE